MATKAEQETTVTHVREDDLVAVYTSNPVHLRRLRKDDRATEVKGGADWAMFTIPADQFSPITGFKRKSRPMTEEQRAAASARLEEARRATSA